MRSPPRSKRVETLLPNTPSVGSREAGAARHYDHGLTGEGAWRLEVLREMDPEAAGDHRQRDGGDCGEEPQSPHHRLPLLQLGQNDTGVGAAESEGVRQCAAHRALLRRMGRQVDVGTTRRGIVEVRSEEHTSELQSLMRISYAVLSLTK